MNGARRQRGVALVVSLLLLVIVALVGLAAVRGTLMQQKMAANSFDREQAFQAAESALRVANSLLLTSPNLQDPDKGYIRNCVDNACPVNPFAVANLSSNFIHDVNSGSGSDQTYTASGVAAMQPQYVIDIMCNDKNCYGSSSTPSDSSNGFNYGVDSNPGNNSYYRITARSGDPAKVGDRAVVTIQAWIKKSS
jgi:type IV pilus assembly protein PilX